MILRCNKAIMKDLRKKIGIDIDGVLANFIHHFRILNNTLHNVTITEDPTDWDFQNWGLTNHQLSMSWAELQKTEGFWTSLKKCDDVKQSHIDVLDDKAQLFFVTTRASTVGMPREKQTNDWLKKTFRIKHPTVIVTSNKGLVAAALELDAFIDDNYDNLWSVYFHSPKTKLYYRTSTYQVPTYIPLTEVDCFHDFVVDVLKEDTYNDR